MAKRKAFKTGEVIVAVTGVKADATKLEMMALKINAAHAAGGNAFRLFAWEMGRMLNQFKHEVAKAAFKWESWSDKLRIDKRMIERYMQLSSLYKTMPVSPDILASGQKVALLSIDEMIAVGVDADDNKADPVKRLEDAILYKTAVVAVKKAAQKREAAAKNVVKAKAKAAGSKAVNAKMQAKRAAQVDEAENELDDADADVEKAERDLKKIPVKYKPKPMQAKLDGVGKSSPILSESDAYAAMGIVTKHDAARNMHVLVMSPIAAFGLGYTKAIGAQEVSMTAKQRAQVIALLTTAYNGTRPDVESAFAAGVRWFKENRKEK
jgi:hypothetical protein